MQEFIAQLLQILKGAWRHRWPAVATAWAVALLGWVVVQIIPDNPRGPRSKSIEKRALGRGNWNTYDLVAVDGVAKLSVNGKFVNGIRHSSRRKGYLCLEAEGAEIHFRNMYLMELPPGVTTPDMIAPERARP